MTSGPAPSLKRPWEVESNPPPLGDSKLGSPIRHRPGTRSYGQDVSGWHYNPFQEPSQPWGRGEEPSAQQAAHEVNLKRTRLQFEHGEAYRQQDSADRFSAAPSSDHLGPRQGYHPHASALGPVLSLGYMPAIPAMPPSPEYGRNPLIQGPPPPILPSPASLAGSGMSSQTSVPSLPPLGHPAPPPPLPQVVHPNPVTPARRESVPRHRPTLSDPLELRRLYDDLVQEHDRVKTRLATYDRKSKAADEELAILHEDKFALQDRVNALEKELEDIRRQKSEVQELHSREGAQWRQIISLSNQLQKQHTEEVEKWRGERTEMVGRIEELQDQLRKMRITSASGSAESGSQAEVDDDSSASRDEGPGGAFLSREIQRVRSQEEQTRQRLRDYQQGNRELRDLLGRVKGIMERLDSAAEPIDTSRSEGA